MPLPLLPHQLLGILLGEFGRTGHCSPKLPFGMVCHLHREMIHTPVDKFFCFFAFHHSPPFSSSGLSWRLPLNLMSFIFTFILPVISVTLDNTAFLSAGKFVEVGPAHILQAPTKLSGKTSAEPHDVANFVH